MEAKGTGGDIVKHRRWLATLGTFALVAALAATPSLSQSARADDGDGQPAFHLIARMPIASEPGRQMTEGEGWILLDSVHRRAYVYEEPPSSDILFHVYDLDAIANGVLSENGVPIRLHQTNEISAFGSPIAQPQAGSKAAPLWTIDPAGKRILYVAGGLVYEVPTEGYDPQTGHPAANSVHAWSSVPDTEEHVNNGPSTNGPDGTMWASGVAVAPDGMSYDAGDEQHPQRVYIVSHVAQGATQDGVVISGWDASGGDTDTGTWRHPQKRLIWTYEPRSCGDPADSQLGAPIYRSGDWLYTFCQAPGDSGNKGILRVKLGAGSGTPDPTTEEFFAGVPGADVQTHVDTGNGRVYLTSTSRAARNVMVFDGSANEGRGAYTGEIALTQKPDPTHEGLDPTTHRWYFLTSEGLWYEDGDLRRVAQAIGPQPSAPDATAQDAPDVDLANGDVKELQPLAIDPAVPGVRPTRIFVARVNTPSAHECPTESKCFEVYEDTSPLPAEVPPPDESDFTQNVPEGPGKTGQFDGVTSAYGVRLRVYRGLSTVWPISSVANTVSFETPPNHNPPEGPLDYAQGFGPTDPFYYFGGDCGRSDRQVTIGAIRQTAIHGDLSTKDASAEARPVDPDINQSAVNLPDNTQTTHDMQYVTNKDDEDKDPCAIGLLRTMSHPATGSDALWDGIEQGAGPKMDWPYPTAKCQGDGTDNQSGSVQGVLVPAAATVTCSANANEPGVSAQTAAQLNPTGFPVSVQSVQTSTSMTRQVGKGLVSEATSIVKGISIEGVIDIRELRVTATARALGFCKSSEEQCLQGQDPDGGTPNQVDVKREFFDVSLGGTPICTDRCDPTQVIDTINRVIAPIGYARAADPEPDVTQRRKESTLAVVQKNQVLQDSDAATNNDLSSEWPGLEIVVYRDATQRGRGRWEMQLGGVYTQSKFGVVDAVDESTPPPTDTPKPTKQPKTTPTITIPPVISHGPHVEGHPGTPAVAAKVIPGTFHKGTAAVAPHQVAAPADDSAPAAEPEATPPPDDGAQALAVTNPGRPTSTVASRSLKGALLLLALWLLVYMPVYVARRRQFLKEVMRGW